MKKLVPALAAPKPAAAGGTTLNVTAIATGLMFSTKSLKAKAGKITIRLTNKSPLVHDLVIEKGEKILAKTPMLKQNTAGTLTITLKKGTLVVS